MDDSNLEAVQRNFFSAISNLSSAIKEDVEDLISDVSTELTDLQKSITQPFLKKNKTARDILKQVESYTKKKQALKNDIQSKLKDSYYPKWCQYLEEMCQGFVKKVDDMLDESTLDENPPIRSPPKVSFAKDQSSVSSWRGEKRSENAGVIGERVPRVLLARCSPESGWRNQNHPEDMEVIEEVEERPSRLSSRRSVRESWKRNDSEDIAELTDEEEEEEQEDPAPSMSSRRSYVKVNKRKRSLEPSPVEQYSPKRKPRQSTSKLYPSLELEEMEENSDVSVEEEEEEEEVKLLPKRPNQKRSRRSVASSRIEEVPRYSATKQSPMNTSVMRSRRSNAGRMSTPNPGKTRLFDTSTETKKPEKSLAQPSPEQSRPGVSRRLSSFWIPLSAVPENTSEVPAVYQIKIHQAKKPAYIGYCANLRSQLMKYQKGEPTGKKHLDKYIQRNYESVEVQSEAQCTLENAKEECQAMLDEFKESNKKLPAYNN